MTKHDFDTAAPTVAAFVVSVRLIERSTAKYAELDALGLESVAEPVGIVAAVAEQTLSLEQVIKQRGLVSTVTDLPGGQGETQGAAIRIGDSIELSV